VSRRSPFVVSLSAGDRVVLERRADAYKVPHAQVVRARIVLLAAESLANTVIAERLGVCVDVGSRWRKRFSVGGLAGLKDRPRSGRPKVFGPAVTAAIKALGCQPREAKGCRVEVELGRAGWPSGPAGIGGIDLAVDGAPLAAGGSDQAVYKRRGTLAYMGAYDVHAARLIGSMAATTGIVPFMTLVERVMNT
jgi:hypothetical protein